MGPLKREELSSRLADVAFELPIGEVSEVLDMPYGLHIITVEERHETRQKSLDEVREDLRIVLEDRKYEAALEEFLKKARTEAQWNVNKKYQAYLPAGASGESSSPR